MTALFRAHRTTTAARLHLASPPQWARLEDSRRDVSDEWMTATGTEDSATAYFDHAQVWCEPTPQNDPYWPGEWQDSAILKGVCVIGGTGGDWTHTYHDRDDLIARFGAAWVEAIEADQSAQENGL